MVWCKFYLKTVLVQILNGTSRKIQIDRETYAHIDGKRHVISLTSGTYIVVQLHRQAIKATFYTVKQVFALDFSSSFDISFGC